MLDAALLRPGRLHKLLVAIAEDPAGSVSVLVLTGRMQTALSMPCLVQAGPAGRSVAQARAPGQAAVRGHCGGPS